MAGWISPLGAGGNSTSRGGNLDRGKLLMLLVGYRISRGRSGLSWGLMGYDDRQRQQSRSNSPGLHSDCLGLLLRVFS